MLSINSKEDNFENLLEDLDKNISKIKLQFPLMDYTKRINEEKSNNNKKKEITLYDLISKYQLDNSNLQYENFYLKKQNKFLENEIKKLNEQFEIIKNDLEKFNVKIDKFEQIKEQNIQDLNEKYTLINTEKNKGILKKDKKDIKEEYSFIKYFFEVFKLEKINEFKELINKSYKEFIEHSGIVGANLFQDNKIFTFSQIHSSKIFDCLKLREDYIYKNFSFLKNADIVKNIFYYSIYLIHDGYIQENLKSLNEYFALFFILICCDIQHKFEGTKNSNESLLYNILEYFFDFFFTNFFIFYYSNIEQKEFKKIFYNILRISRIMSDLTKKNSLFSSYTCNPKSKIISSLKKFQIIKIIQDNNQNDNNQYSYLNDGLMELFTSNDDNIILDNIEKNLQNKKEMNLQIIRDLYEKENDDFDKEQIYDIKKEVKNFYLKRKKNFNKEYLKNKNKEDYIKEYQNY